MADLIAQSLTVTTESAGGTTRLQIFGGTVPNQFLTCDFEIPAADSNSLVGGLTYAPKFFVGNQTVDLSAASNTAYNVVNSSGLSAGQQISVGTNAMTKPNTVLSINSVVNATQLRVTFVSGANAASVTSGDPIVVSSPAANATTTLNYAAGASPLVGVYNAL